jgi:hypothetical protein
LKDSAASSCGTGAGTTGFATPPPKYLSRSRDTGRSRTVWPGTSSKCWAILRRRLFLVARGVESRPDLAIGKRKKDAEKKNGRISFCTRRLSKRAASPFLLAPKVPLGMREVLDAQHFYRNLRYSYLPSLLPPPLSHGFHLHAELIDRQSKRLGEGSERCGRG